MRRQYGLVMGTCLYLVGLAALFVPPALTMSRAPVYVMDSQGHINHATIWSSAEPRAVILIGHGVTANQGIMAMIAKAFAHNGYAAVAFDFWGHGHARESFNWSANPQQIFSMFDWARINYPDLPIAYLGYSMGGFAGAQAFNEKPVADAFVALGALPGAIPDCKTAIAAGIFEELFSIDYAKESVGDKADVISSPFSNHATAASDPLLIARILAWVDEALGFPGDTRFPWITWLFSMIGIVVGCAGALLAATGMVGLISGKAVTETPRSSSRRWSINPYRIMGMALGMRGVSTPPRSGPLPSAFLRGLLCGLLIACLLAVLLSVHVFTVSMFNPGRLLMWLAFAFVAIGPVFLDAWILERVPLKSTGTRFAVAATTRGVPLLALAIGLRLLHPGLGFIGMMFGIRAFIAVMLSLVHALTTRTTCDWRAGATAVTVVCAWVFAFWFPFYWPWSH